MSTKIANWNTFLTYNNACTEGYEAHKDQTPNEFWQTCQRADWMLWVVQKNEGLNNLGAGFKFPDKTAIVKMSCEFAKRSLKHLKGEKNKKLLKLSKEAIKAALAWCKAPSEENVKKCLDAANAAARYAAYAAAYAAYAADAADAASAAADAASAAANAAARYADASFRSEAEIKEQKAQSDIVRKIWNSV